MGVFSVASVLSGSVQPCTAAHRLPVHGILLARRLEAGCCAHLSNPVVQATQIDVHCCCSGALSSPAACYLNLYSLLSSARFAFCSAVSTNTHPNACPLPSLHFTPEGQEKLRLCIDNCFTPSQEHLYFFSPQVYPMLHKSGSQPRSTPSTAKTFKVQNPGRNTLVPSGSHLCRMPPTARNEPMLTPRTDFLLPLEGASRPPLQHLGLLLSICQAPACRDEKVNGWDLPVVIQWLRPRFPQLGGCKFDPWSRARSPEPLGTAKGKEKKNGRPR